MKRKNLLLTDHELDVLNSVIGYWQEVHVMNSDTIWKTYRDNNFTPKELAEISRIVDVAYFDKYYE